MEERYENIDFEKYLKNTIDPVNTDHLSINNWSYSQLYSFINKEINLRSTLFILVQNGKGKVTINNKVNDIKSYDILLLSFGHFFKLNALSQDFLCVAMYVSREYAQNMFSSDMLYKRVKYGNKMYKQPMQHFTQEAFRILNERIVFIRNMLMQYDHLYRDEQTLNALRIFFLDLSNIIEKSLEDKDIKTSMDEIYFQKFLDLLAYHFKREHLVEFYAQKIHITPHYLTLIVKKFTDQSASEFLYQLLLSEAKSLLRQKEISIQQISITLNFSDQSAFGKFFKRKTGVSPKEFRLIN